MQVSVIIPAYNEEDEIVECLQSLGEQTYGDFEIIVVDDGSTDRTLGRVRRLANTINSLTTNHKPLITLFQQRHLGPGAARNLGAKHAKGKILAFVDADMTFEPDFIESLVEPIIEGRAQGTFSKDEYVSNWGNVWARCWNINQNWPEGRRHHKNYPDEDTVFRAILKSEFDRVGGFTSGGYTDDYSLSEKLGYKSKAAEAKFYHKNPGSLLEVFRQAVWVGKRRYKLGYLGYAVALFRSSLPVSILIGVAKSLVHFLPAFLPFKIIYDFGIFWGIGDYAISGRGSK